MRTLASIQKILAVDPIEGADAIVRVKVLGWECVAKKEEFKVGDNCVYFEIDSLLPVAPWTDFLRKGDERPFRLRTVKLRDQISQGLALPFEKIPSLPEGTSMEIGTDLTELLHVEKWEMQVPAQLAGQVRGNFPAFLSKTDETRLQAAPDALDEAKASGMTFVGRKKIDGTSATFYVNFDGEVAENGVCSRNLDLKETEDNTYWKMAKKEQIHEKLRQFADELRRTIIVSNVAIQAELAGPGIQGNKMGYKELKLVVFNLVVNGVYWDDYGLVDFASVYGLELAPEVFRGIIPNDWTVGSMLKMAEALDYDNGTPCEGIVWRSATEMHSKALKGRMSFKTISNRFLLKYKE